MSDERARPTTPPPDRAEPTHAFRAAVEHRDHEAMMAALAPQIRFHTPVYLHPIEDRRVVGILLEVLLDLFQDFRYTDELHGASVHGLLFRARVDELELEGIDLLRFDDSGLVDDFTVMIRPFTALERLRDTVTPAMAERLQD